MNSNEYIDLEQYSRNECTTEGATHFKVRIDDQHVYVNGSNVTGRQLLDLAKRSGEKKESIFVKRLRDKIEEIDIHHSIVLENGILCFLTLDTTRPHKYILDEQEREWYGNLISGRALKEKADVDPNRHTVWRKYSGKNAQEIADRCYSELSLNYPIEFFTAPMNMVAG